ncbi:MAG: helicase C-terminal domain-containing protein [Candidatus Edwardsbacteria bacterium]
MKQKIGSFVALDLETTGINLETSEIIELGAVKVEDGKITQRFSQLLKPKGLLPLSITRLTGIKYQDLQNCPLLETILPQLLVFLSEEPLVVHNASFDFGFLKRHTQFSNEVFDTLELARLLLPTLSNHKLPTLLEYFAIPFQQSHRALSDAENTAKLFLKLLDLLSSLELGTLRIINQLVQTTDWTFKEIFASRQKRALKQKWVNKEAKGQKSEKAERQKCKSIQDIDFAECEKFFKRNSIFSKCLDGFEHRLTQVKMTEAVKQAFEREEFLIVEAGTGTGKSLAYLIPSVLWAKEKEKRVVLSTYTKNLQEQLFYKDIPVLKNILGNFNSALLKGRSNYLCLRKWTEGLRTSNHIFTAEERKSLLPLVKWVEETETGDISENAGFSLSQKTNLWYKLSCEGGDCFPNECKFASQCFLMKARIKAEKSQIIVVNHSLLFSDLASENAILIDYDCLIFDEAHRIEKVASEQLSISLNFFDFYKVLTSLYSSQPIESGLLVVIRERLKMPKVKKIMQDFFSRKVRNLIRDIRETENIIKDFFQNLTLTLQRLTNDYPKRRYRENDEFLSQTKEWGGGLETNLRHIERELSDLKEGLSENEAFQEISLSLLRAMRDCQILRNNLIFLLNAKNEDYVYWVEWENRTEASPEPNNLLSSYLIAAPLEVGPLLAKKLYARMKTIIFTSATLKIGDNFDFLKNCLGLDLFPSERLQTIALGSVFDFPRQSLILIPSYLPLPTERIFSKEIGNFLDKLLLTVKRGSLILFTSWQMLKEMYSTLKDELEKNQILLLGQGFDGSSPHLLERFREEKDSVLFGTESFWEGIDVPGEALEVLVLVRLPFPVPTDPLVEAHCERLQKKGLDPFYHYSLPQAVMKLSQGFGRLIRTKEDKGIVLILDKRIAIKHYGQVFLANLPTEYKICRNEKELLQEAKRFFGSVM